MVVKATKFVQHSPLVPFHLQARLPLRVFPYLMVKLPPNAHALQMGLPRAHYLWMVVVPPSSEGIGLNICGISGK